MGHLRKENAIGDADLDYCPSCIPSIRLPLRRTLVRLSRGAALRDSYLHSASLTQRHNGAKVHEAYFVLLRAFATSSAKNFFSLSHMNHNTPGHFFAFSTLFGNSASKAIRRKCSLRFLCATSCLCVFVIKFLSHFFKSMTRRYFPPTVS